MGEGESVLPRPCLRPEVWDYSLWARPWAPNGICLPLEQKPVFLSCAGPADKYLTSSSRCWDTAVSHALLKVRAVQRAPERPWGAGPGGGAQAGSCHPRRAGLRRLPQDTNLGLPLALAHLERAV